MKKKNNLFRLSLILLLSLLSLSFFLKQQRKRISAQISGSPALILTDSPTLPSDLTQEFSINLNSGDEFDLAVYLEPDGEPITAVDVELNFDPLALEVLDKTDGTLFPTYVQASPSGYLDPDNGIINLSAVAFDTQSQQPSAPVSAAGKFAQFQIKVKDSLSSQVSPITFNPQTATPGSNLTTDTNIVALVPPDNQPQDILSKVNIYKVIIEQPGDINGDSTVNIDDFFLIARYYGQKEFDLRADINRDGVVGIDDFFQIARNYGATY